MRFPPPVVAPRPHPDVLQSHVGGGRVLFNLRDRRLHVLNPTAGAIWDGLRDAATVGDIAIAVSDRFGAEPRVVRPDVERMIDRFRGDGLVTVEDRIVRSSVLPEVTEIPVPLDSPTFAALDAIVAISTDDDEVRDALASVFAPLATAAPASSSIHVCGDESGWVVESSNRAPAAVGSRLAAVLLAVSELNHLAVASVPDELVLHAGAVGRNGRVALLPAASNHGKSTLTTALVGSGFDYLSDEAAAVGPGLVCRPFPKAIALDPGSFALFPHLAPPDADGVVGALRGREWHVDPGRVGSAGEAAPVGVVVCPHWRAGSVTRATRCAPTDALHLLLGETFDFALGGQAVFARMTALVDSVPVYRLGYSDMGEAVEVVSALLADPDTCPG